MAIVSGDINFDETSAFGQELVSLDVTNAVNIISILIFNEDLTRTTTARLYINNSGSSLRAELARDLILVAGVNNLIRWPCAACTDIQVQLSCDGAGATTKSVHYDMVYEEVSAVNSDAIMVSISGLSTMANTRFGNMDSAVAALPIHAGRI